MVYYIYDTVDLKNRFINIYSVKKRTFLNEQDGVYKLM